MKNKNISTLNSMIRLSRIIRNFKNARRELNQVIVQTEYFIIQGESSNTLEVKTKQSIDNTLYLEQYLRSSVGYLCKCLDGFDSGKMDPIDYISTTDVTDGIVDICRGGKVVANINLSSGKIFSVKPETLDAGEDKSSAEKS